MSERGIIFGAPMIWALLAGKKTQTRRVVSRTNCILDGHKRATAEHWGRLDLSMMRVDVGPSPAGNPGPYLKARCDCWGAEEEVVHRLYPQWHVGQRLWVREVFAIETNEELGEYGPPHEDGRPIEWLDGGDGDQQWWNQPHYRATDPTPDLSYGDAGSEPVCRWRSPIYMPRWASRLTLEIVRVGVERLYEISEEDARAEGVERGDGSWAKDGDDVYMRDVSGWYAGHLRYNSPDHAFRTLWDTINGQKPGCSWDDGPFVWVLEFRVTGGSDE